ncbi:cysteine-rich DPF motif domain-containing protein 1 [Geothlypis trichas]
MNAPKEDQTAGEFRCELCELAALCTYYGQMSPNSPAELKVLKRKGDAELLHCLMHNSKRSKSSTSVKYTLKSLKLFFFRLLEEACVMRDPFTPDKDKFLVIRSHCSLCSRALCVGTNCSLFHSKSFCLPCVKENLKAFPLEIQDMDKRKPQQKSCK